jgi:CBS domain containing-hemolysin-like protein
MAEKNPKRPRDLNQWAKRMVDRRIADIMTPRVDIDWIDADDPHEEILEARGSSAQARQERYGGR